MSDYPMLISNKLHSFRNFQLQIYYNVLKARKFVILICKYRYLFANKQHH